MTLVVSVVKEVADGCLGGRYDWKDIEAAMLGCACVYLSALAGLLL